MKKKILIMADDSSNWIGGLYYKRNILFSLLQNNEICNKYHFVVSVKEENKRYFECFKNDIRFVNVKPKSKWGKLCFLLRSVGRQIKYIYPLHNNKYWKFAGITCIAWIADFQHNVYPENFMPGECNIRNREYEKVFHDEQPLVLSSESARKDFEKYYGIKSNVYVVHFVSYIESELSQLTITMEQEILIKYHLEEKEYLCISNQFWKHKNHIVVLKAIKILKERYANSKLLFVFTGMPKDYRNPDYFESLMELFQDCTIKESIQILGFIDRIEQIAVMKNAKFIIQPSLFEGWGTVVEDAKVLDKMMLLSDIPVHHEQMNENCVLFNPNNPEDLAEKILNMSQKKHKENIENGIQDMYTRAKEYSKEFLKMLEDTERK